MKKWIIGGAVSLALLAAAAGAYGVATAGPSEAEQRAEARYERAVKQYRADLRAYKQDVDEWKQAKAKQAECEAEVGDLLTEAQNVAGRVAAGLYPDEYTKVVGDLGAVYAQADVTNCFAIGLALEEAVGHYSEAGDEWQDCMEDIYCDLDALVDPDGDADSKVQELWVKGQAAVQDAEDAMDDLAPGERPERPERPRKGEKVAPAGESAKERCFEENEVPADISACLDEQRN